jgi:hypothetical protein
MRQQTNIVILYNLTVLVYINKGGELEIEHFSATLGEVRTRVRVHFRDTVIDFRLNPADHDVPRFPHGRFGFGVIVFVH